MADPQTSSHWTVQPRQGLESLHLHENTSVPQLKENECLVKIEAVSLNYRDVGIPNGNYPVATKPDLIPCSDAAGTIVAVGSEVKKFHVGDAVCSVFHPNHRSGALTNGIRNAALGGLCDGVLQQYATFAEHAIVHAPKSLNTRESSTLPCAAVTAWNALFGLESRQLRAGDTVLTQGTGGVSLFAIQFAVAIGATVIATTSSAQKAAKLKELGATHVINYRDDPNWGETAKALTPDKEGVQHVIEVGGDSSVAQSLKAIRAEGVISIIGFLGGTSAAEMCSFMNILTTSAIVRGTYVGPIGQFEEMNRFIDQHSIRPILAPTTFAFRDAPKAFQHLWDAQHVGKVVIDVDGHHRP